MLTTFPQRNFSLELPEILSKNHICYHWLSVSGISKIMYCGILINMPYYHWVRICASLLHSSKKGTFLFTTLVMRIMCILFYVHYIFFRISWIQQALFRVEPTLGDLFSLLSAGVRAAKAHGDSISLCLSGLPVSAGRGVPPAAVSEAFRLLLALTGYDLSGLEIGGICGESTETEKVNVGFIECAWLELAVCHSELYTVFIPHTLSWHTKLTKEIGKLWN